MRYRRWALQSLAPPWRSLEVWLAGCTLRIRDKGNQARDPPSNTSFDTYWEVELLYFLYATSAIEDNTAIFSPDEEPEALDQERRG